MAAEYRSVQTGMWREDEWFQTLELDARLFWMYLFTNPSASVAGIYRLPLRTMAFESGVDQDRIEELLAEFAKAGKAYFANGVVWVRKMREYQLPGKVSPQLQAHIAREIDKIPAGHLKDMYLKAYGYPIDTVSIPRLTDTETDTETETDTDTETESERGATFTPGPIVARASVTRSVGTKPNPKLSPQVNLFAKVTGFYPARSVHHIVDAAIDTRNDEALLRQCYEAWLLRGFRKENLAWLTEWYTAGGVPTTQRGNNGNSGHTRADTRDGYNIPAGYEGLVNTDVRTVTAPDPWRDLLAEADALAPMVRQTPQVKERTLKQLTRKLDGMLAALPLPYDAALATLGERLA